MTIDGSDTNKVTLDNYFLGGKHLIESIAFETGGQISAQQIFGAFGIPRQAESHAMRSANSMINAMASFGNVSNDTNLANQTDALMQPVIYSSSV